MFITEAEFNQLQVDHRAGSLDVSMPREVARQFFLRIRNAEVKQTTGKSIVFQKLLIWFTSVASPIVFVASLVFFWLGHSAWEAALILPIAGICWTVIYGLASTQGGWLIGTIPLIIAASPLVNSSGTATDPVTLFVLALWLQRTSYLLAHQWLMSIVMDHYDAFEMMEQHLNLETQ